MFLGAIILILVLKSALPPEATALAGEILIKVLTLVKTLLSSVSL